VEVTLTDVFDRNMIVCCTGLATAAQVKASPTTSVFSLLGFNAAGSATDDTSIDFIALGYGSTDEF
jgi:hypothetical protein